MLQQSFVAFCAIGALPLIALAGPDWVERGDAGKDLRTAQVTAGIGGITTIFGELNASGRGENDFEDMYIIRIDQPATFSFSLSNVNFSPSFYLFNITQANEALGLLGKQSDGASSLTLGPTASDDTGAQVTQPGLYALVITFGGNVPRSRNGPIFLFEDEGETSGPDGTGGINPLETWQPTQSFAPGSYLVEVEGVDFADVPSPGTAALIIGGGLFASRRRR